ncbi:MAG: transcriptional repressor [Muribaculaceae bacterium]|nr:transcriptional repressor [Muribaculaceae bacterium]
MKLEEVEKILTDKGVKPTSNRILVLKELAGFTHPVSLADLEDALDTMDKASIFRVLELFAEKDLVHVIEDGSRSSKYELCHNHHTHSIEDQHVHFYCTNCKETICFEDMKIPKIEVPEGYMPHSVNFVVKGLCRKCSKKNE